MFATKKDAMPWTARARPSMNLRNSLALMLAGLLGLGDHSLDPIAVRKDEIKPLR